MRRFPGLFLLACLPVTAEAALPLLQADVGQFNVLPAASLPAEAAYAGGAPQAAGEIRFSSLAELSDYALRTRAESRAAWLAVQAQANLYRAERAALWPSLSGQLSFTQSQSLSSSGSQAGTQNRYGPSLSLGWVLYDFGARSGRIDAARYAYLGGLLGSNQTLLEILQQVETATYAWQGAVARIAAEQENVESAAGVLAAAELRAQGGLVPQADVLRARTVLGDARLALADAQRLAVQSLAAVRQAAGIPQTRRLLLAWDPPPAPAAGPELLLGDLMTEARKRPELQGLLAQVARARAEAETLRVSRLPSLELVASAGRTYFLEDRAPSTTYSWGLALRMPLYDAGALRARADAAELSARQQEQLRLARQGEVDLAVAQAYYGLEYVNVQLGSVATQIESATASARAAEARYRAGLGTLLELLSAQADLARARSLRAQANTDWYAAHAQLRYALGRLPMNGQQP
jgi:outer membrane protein